MVLISWISITARFACWVLFITAQIAMLYYWDWHVEISATIYNCPHWNRRVFRMWGYRDSITVFMIRETLPLSCVQWKRESPRRAYGVNAGERFNSCGCRGKKESEILSSARCSLLGSNVSSGQGSRLSPRVKCELGTKARASLIGVECELGARSEALSSGLNVSQLVYRVRCPLHTPGAMGRGGKILWKELF